MLRFILGSLLVVLTCADAHARDYPGLRGLESVFFLVEGLSIDSKPCGIDEQTIKNSVAYPLANSRLKINDGAEVTLYAQVTTIYHSEIAICASSISLLVYVFQSVRINETNNAARVQIILWHKATLITGGRDGHRSEMRESLEDLTKQLVIDWTAAQR